LNILTVENVNTGYEKKQVLFDVSINVQEGQTTLLVGPNGSGKSTLLKLICSILPIWKSPNAPSSITYQGRDLSKLKTSELISFGIVYVPQNNSVFEDFLVIENLEASLRWESNRTLSNSKIADLVCVIPSLKPILFQKASTLSGGEKKLLSIGMAHINEPKLLLIDEPLAGVSKDNQLHVIESIRQLKEKGVSMIIIEHKIREVLHLADHVLGMKLGKASDTKLHNLNEIKEFMV
jgi:branched-chain amino acid transport system ATP-binding protein